METTVVKRSLSIPEVSANASQLLKDAACANERGHNLCLQNQFREAEECFRIAILANPFAAMPRNNIGWIYERQGKLLDAIESYKVALTLDPALGLAQHNLASLLTKLGRFEEALPLWQTWLAAFPHDLKCINKVIDATLKAGAITEASAFATQHFAKKRGSRYFEFGGLRTGECHLVPSALEVSVEKLRHDIAQFSYLQKNGILVLECETFKEQYHRVLNMLLTEHDGKRKPLGEKENQLIGDTYGRIVHIRQTGRVEGEALNGWNKAEAECKCLDDPLGTVVIDNFLTNSALTELRLFCLHSTVWHTNRYAHGRLGAFFREGFACPLLAQIAEELRSAFPRLIGQNNCLDQIWAFKYGHQPATPPHADFAAVNINFWITPDHANLDPESGGLTVYDLTAPSDWDFASFNSDGPKITSYIERKRSTSRNIAYRANRAVIFRSDLFHSTMPVNFSSDYENRRINITMLFGKRASSN